ncbi:MAG: site-2 protease family protein [Deltaproteobacteria bacterium]|nr:site-2 protease family protein [Deltaproteobacteria bacterium]
MNEGYAVHHDGQRQGRVKLILWPALLLVATILTTVTAGALYQGADIFSNPGSMTQGIPFSAALLAILGTHELGHYVASRRHGVQTTLPLFIPGPPIPPMIGTFGAVIRIRSAITTKNALVDIGAAGPLAGFVVAIFVTGYGLSLSTVAPYMPTGQTLGLGSSLIFRFLSYLTLGVTPEGVEIFLHPVAFAGWIGLFVTAMNLLPLGQLDGGHIVYAVIGTRHRWFSIVMAATLIALGAVYWSGWFVWAALISIIGLGHPPIEDQSVPMDAKRRVITAISTAVFVLTFMPAPFYII